MISYIKINGFKSFFNFEMEFTPLTIIAGANASGKSNLFDALALLSDLAETDNIKKAFKNQRGDFLELFTLFDDGGRATEMDFCVEMLVNKSVKDAWGNEVELKYTRLRYELKIGRITNEMGLDDLEVRAESLVNLKHQEDKWIKIIPNKNLEIWRPIVKTGKRAIPYMQTIWESNIPTVLVPQDGTSGKKRRFPLKNATRTVLSSFDTTEFPHVLATKEEMRSWRFLQLNPEDLRKPTSKQLGEDNISHTGANLAATLFRIKQEDPYLLIEISRKLNSFLPEFIAVDVIDDKENKQYLLYLKDNGGKEYTSRVLSEGTLRILALCVLQYDSKHTSLLCFEEPENGIHPYRIRTMANLLKDLSSNFDHSDTYSLRQVIVNTHSPQIVRVVSEWEQNNWISIWFSKLKKVITDFEGKRISLFASNILPVDKSKQLTMSFSEQERKMTLIEVGKYLNEI